MSRPVVFIAVLAGVIIAGAGWHIWRAPATEALYEPDAAPPEAEPLCPWRNPESDLKTLFPAATDYQVETRILSGQRLELARRLGRPVAPDESALHLWRIYCEQELLGTVATKRVKGQYGAIELVLAIDPSERVQGLRLQRLREPEPIARAIENPAWLEAFKGMQASHAWKAGQDLAAVPPQAAASAQAIVQGAHSLLILLDLAEHTPGTLSAATHHH